MAEHTPECLAQAAAAEAARAAWRARWPHHCRACEGRGGAGESYDPSPAGLSLGAGWLYDWYPCESCVEAGRCPRCAARTMADDGDCDTCFACGWDGRRPDHLPPEPACVCQPLGY